jgi:hypothetical protein
MSFDFKLMFLFHGCMKILLIIGGMLSTRQEFAFSGALLFVLISLSVRRRRLSGWHGHGLKPPNLLIAAGVAVLMFVFLYAATAQISPLTSKFLPWYLAGLGIGTFNVRQQLRLVSPSEEAFLTDCSYRKRTYYVAGC